VNRKLLSSTAWIIMGTALFLYPEIGMGAAAPSKVSKPSAGTKGAQQAPIVVTSERMESNDTNKTVVFLGNVIAEKGDVTIYSDRMEVYSNKETNKISRIVADGHVRIVQQGGKNATGEHAVYYDDEQKVVLTGNPKAWQGENVVTGTEITSYLKENRSVVQGSPQTRVRAVIVPGEEDRKRIGGPQPSGKTEENR